MVERSSTRRTRSTISTPRSSSGWRSSGWRRRAASACCSWSGREITYNYHTIVTTFERSSARLGIETQVLSPPVDRPPAAAMRQFGRDIAEMSPRPDGIICDSELGSIFMIAGLEDEGIVAGRDVHFICKQTSDLLPALYPQIDTIEEDVLAAGVELARLLIRRIDGEPAEELRTLGEPKVHWRD